MTIDSHGRNNDNDKPKIVLRFCATERCYKS